MSHSERFAQVSTWIRPSTPESKGGGYHLALLSALASAGVTVIGKWCLVSISPLLLNCLIFSIAAVVLTLSIVPRQGWSWFYRQTPSAWLWIGLFALSSFGALWAFWAGVQRIDPTLAAFLNRAEVFIAVILAMIILSERFSWLEGLGAVICIVGMVIMRLTLRMEYESGFWLVLLGSVFFGIVELVSKIAIRYVEPAVLTGLRSWFLAVAFWIVFAVRGEDFDGLSAVWPGVVALALLGPVVARLLYLWALKRMELAKAAIITQSQPVFVVVLALAALGQLPTVREAWGGVLIGAGTLIMIWARPRPLISSVEASQPDPQSSS
jgi:drug/metabolite transporter (DMT)-like permease